MKQIFTAAAFAAMPVLSLASFHVTQPTEVMVALNGDTAYQFIEIKTLAGGQNFFGGVTLRAFNADGSAFSDYVFASDNSASSSNQFILAATPQASLVMGITPEYADLPAGFFNVGSGRIQLVGAWTFDYGTYTGSGASNLAPTIPGADMQSLTRTANSGTNATDFSLADNTPENTGGSIGHVEAPAAVTGWELF